VVVIGLGGRGVKVVDELFDAVLTGYRLVVDNLQFRDTFQPETCANLPPEKRYGTVKRSIGLAPTLLVSQRRIEHTRLLEVPAHVNTRDRDEPQPGVVYLTRQHQT
jgi:hypothetical protein